MALIDPGSEFNVKIEDLEIKTRLSTRTTNMKIKGIEGVYKSLVGLSEFTQITLITGEGRNINIFVSRGEVNCVLGLSFLSDSKIRLDFSQKEGEMFRYIEPDGRKFCLPIFSPQKAGWREYPPVGMEAYGI
ncbi:hypothetical protein O181_051203 [Austropuccinia psidii MF-1]|uniref:Peptidase A2 domain-containing protein n=1 Tax=Austropuccinia psidii MF-1 TaxID=1389203 RepID=A0A9Q3E0I5_9BASI|nr:hypothetical protein [Austropuccinia psidii MF-1]